MVCPGNYATMIRSKDHSFDMRKTLVRVAKAKSLRTAADTYEISRNTVRKWSRRFKRDGFEGLRSRSTRPKHSPNKVSRQVENQVLEARARSGFGAQRLIEEFELPCGLSAVRRILREYHLTRKPRKKHERKNDLREVKKKLAPFERLQIDVKHLKDQPHYLPQAKQLGLPLYQFTVRDERTGALWLNYATECAAIYAELTIRRLLRHLKANGVDLKLTVVKSDNGSEFKGQQLHLDARDFAQAVRDCGADHRFNPPSCPNANADVESSHSRIEPEFYDRANFLDLADFLNTACQYQNYWNIGRPNRSKDNRTPWEILHDLQPNVSMNALLLEPVLLDTLLQQQQQQQKRPQGVGHYVPPPPGEGARGRLHDKALERVMGIEPTTSTLGTWRSTAELHPRIGGQWAVGSGLV
jgi:transposase